MIISGLGRGCGWKLSRVFLVSCMLNGYFLFAQHADTANPSFANFLTWCDKPYGSDDMLVSGRIYLPASPLINGHPYFKEDQWFTSTLYIKGRRFDRQEVRYDLASRQLILNARFKQGATARIILSPANIDSLTLNNHLFINGLHLFPGMNDSSFYEVIYRDQFLFISRYHKEFIKKYSAADPYGVWSRQVPSHLIFIGQWSPVTSKRSFLSFFPAGQEEIKRYMRKNYIKFNKASSEQMKQLVSFSSQYYQP